GLEFRFFGRCQDPANSAVALFRVNQIDDRLDHSRTPRAEFVLRNPVQAGQAGVQNTVGNVARHLLRPDEHAFDLRIVDGGEVRARIQTNLKSGPVEQLNGRVLQRSLRYAQLEFHNMPAPRALE